MIIMKRNGLNSSPNEAKVDFDDALNDNEFAVDKKVSLRSTMKEKMPSVSRIQTLPKQSPEKKGCCSMFTPFLKRKITYSLRSGLAAALPTFLVVTGMGPEFLNFFAVVISTTAMKDNFGDSLVCWCELFLTGIYGVPLTLLVLYCFQYTYTYRLVGLFLTTIWLCRNERLAALTRKFALTIAVVGILTTPEDAEKKWVPALTVYFNILLGGGFSLMAQLFPLPNLALTEADKRIDHLMKNFEYYFNALKRSYCEGTEVHTAQLELLSDHINEDMKKLKALLPAIQMECTILPFWSIGDCEQLEEFISVIAKVHQQADGMRLAAKKIQLTRTHLAFVHCLQRYFDQTTDHTVLAINCISAQLRFRRLLHPFKSASRIQEIKAEACGIIGPSIQQSSKHSLHDYRFKEKDTSHEEAEESTLDNLISFGRRTDCCPGPKNLDGSCRPAPVGTASAQYRELETQVLDGSLFKESTDIEARAGNGLSDWPSEPQPVNKRKCPTALCYRCNAKCHKKKFQICLQAFRRCFQRCQEAFLNNRVGRCVRTCCVCCYSKFRRDWKINVYNIDDLTLSWQQLFFKFKKARRRLLYGLDMSGWDGQDEDYVGKKVEIEAFVLHDRVHGFPVLFARNTFMFELGNIVESLQCFSANQNQRHKIPCCSWLRSLVQFIWKAVAFPTCEETKRFFRDKSLLQFPFKVALAMALLSLPMDQQGLVWGPLTVAYICSKDTSSSFNTGVRRLGGTALGAVFALTINDLTEGAVNWYTAVAVILWTSLMAVSRQSPTYGYAAYVAGFTPPILLLGSLTGEEGVIIRLDRTIKAIFIYLVIDSVLWPVSARPRLVQSISKMLESTAECLNGVKDIFATERPRSTEVYQEDWENGLAIEDLESRASNLRNDIDEGKSLLQLASNEPELWRDPFYREPYSQVIVAQEKVHKYLELLMRACAKLPSSEASVIMESHHRNIAQSVQKMVVDVKFALNEANSALLLSFLPSKQKGKEMNSKLLDHLDQKEDWETNIHTPTQAKVRDYDCAWSFTLYQQLPIPYSKLQLGCSFATD